MHSSLGNVFGGTALSSYGGFWIGLAIILIPGGFEIEEAYGGATFDFYSAFALYVSANTPSCTSKAKLTKWLKPDLRLVHLHLSALANDAQVDVGLQLAVHDGVARFHLPRSSVPRCA